MLAVVKLRMSKVNLQVCFVEFGGLVNLTVIKIALET